MLDEHKHKSFTLSVDFLLTIVLALSIMAAVWIGSLHRQVGVLQEKVGILEDHDIQMGELKHELFKDLLNRHGDKE